MLEKYPLRNELANPSSNPGDHTPDSNAMAQHFTTINHNITIMVYY